MEIAIRNADRALNTFMISLAGVFFVVFVVLNLMLSWLIVQPIRAMAGAADKISTGDTLDPAWPPSGTPSTTAPATGPATGASTTVSGLQGLNPDQVGAIEKALSLYIGPLARTLVRKESTRHADATSVIQALARHIDRPGDQTLFLQAANKALGRSAK